MSDELDKEIMDCWLLSSREEVYKRLAALIDKREREAWEAAREMGRPSQVTITRSNGETETGPAKDYLRTKYETFDDWKKERGGE